MNKELIALIQQWQSEKWIWSALLEELILFRI